MRTSAQLQAKSQSTRCWPGLQYYVHERNCCLDVRRNRGLLPVRPTSFLLRRLVLLPDHRIGDVAERRHGVVSGGERGNNRARNHVGRSVPSAFDRGQNEEKQGFEAALPHFLAASCLTYLRSGRLRGERREACVGSAGTHKGRRSTPQYVICFTSPFAWTSHLLQRSNPWKSPHLSSPPRTSRSIFLLRTASTS